MMKMLPGTHPRHTHLMTAVVVSALLLPLVASAATSNISIAYNKAALESAQGQALLYEKMKTASRKICKIPNNNVIGPLTKPTANAQCYIGTLDAAVKRLDHTAITALHTRYGR